MFLITRWNLDANKTRQLMGDHIFAGHEPLCNEVPSFFSKYLFLSSLRKPLTELYTTRTSG